jgi:hypothetical protein
MQYFKSKVINIILFFLFFVMNSTIFTQNNYINISNFFKGKLIGIGYNTGHNGKTFEVLKSLNLNCNECTSFGKIYLLATEDHKNNSNNLIELAITINNNIISLNENTRITGKKDFFTGWQTNHFKEINLVCQSNGLLDFKIPAQDIFDYYSGFYLLIECLNNSYDETSYNLILNTDLFNTNIEILSTNQISINPINITKDAGFAIIGLIMNYMNGDSNVIKFNNSYLGNIAGQDSSSSDQTGSGVRGHFEYKNGTLFGLDDDTPDNIMNGTDALAKVNDYITNNNSFHFSSLHENPNNLTNITQAAILSYTSNCSSFNYTVAPDTTICPNVPLQLFANAVLRQAQHLLMSGWLRQAQPPTLLSCTDCPNPVFTGDKSTLLTVRIWNNDSCSVVRPIKVNVHPKPSLSKIATTNTDCGTDNGKVVLTPAIRYR